MDQLIKDFISDYLNTYYSDDMDDKYWRKLPIVKIEDVIEYCIENNIADKFIDHTFYGDFRDKQWHFLLKINERSFEVFDSEKGGKHGLQKFDSFKEALFCYFERVFNSYGMTAPDSKIND